jgi:lipopolysaccharide transport system ATP-binding protein
MSSTAIQIEGLGKRYRIGESESYGTFRDTIMKMASWPRRRVRAWFSGGPGLGQSWFWALKDVSFDVGQGEVVGIIGRNGAGKSTLLKVLSRITDPTEGQARLRGRVGCLLEVGAGFHQELSGRENIYMNGALLGMRRAEIKAKMEEIVEFAGVGAFVDTPVKRYSSGMHTRLAFAVAAHLEPEILIVDEVLAVGDAAFQKKCLGKMGEVARHGRTVLFVSHNMSAVEALCRRAVLLEHGRVIDMGEPRKMVHRYLETVSSLESIPLQQRRDRGGDGSARIAAIEITDAEGTEVIRAGSRLHITIHYESDKPIRHPRFEMRMTDVNNVGLFLLDSDLTGGLPEELPASGAVTCVTEPIHLTPGRCYLHTQMRRGRTVADSLEYAGGFDVESSGFYSSGGMPPRSEALCLLRHQWVPGGGSGP